MYKPLSKALLAAAACMLPYLVSTAQAPTQGEEIDLGLSVNWRGYNIGATAPEQQGNLYAYATTKNGGYTMMSYPFFNRMTYTISLPEGNLAGNTQYDAAASDTDGAWQMATKEQWEELIDNCDITAYSYNNVTGALLTSKKNGNSIFLPTATVGYEKSCTYYTSESNGSAPYIATLATNPYVSSSVALQQFIMNQMGPWIGLPLRPVCEKAGVPLESLTLSAEKTEIFAGTSMQLTATPTPADAKMKLIYTSSDESVATVSSKGLVSTTYGSQGGKATITATSDGISASIEITVINVTTDPSENVVDLGLSVDWCARNFGATDENTIGSLVPFCYPEAATLANAFSYKYYKNSKYAFPEENFCGNTAYDAIAYAAVNGGTYAGERLPSDAEYKELIENCEITYITTDSGDGTTLREALCISKINGKAIRFEMSSGSQYYYTGSTGSDKTIAYAFSLSSTAGTSIANVSAPWRSNPLRGVVEHPTIPDLEKIELDITEASIYVENSIRIKATPVPLDALITDLEWKSDNEEVATVDAHGLVTGTGAGTATISAVCGEVSVSATVTVKAVNLTTGNAIDMGTEVLWSPIELGAVSSTENGKYYFWGNTTPQPALSDNKEAWIDPEIDVIGGTEYDPAHVELGGRWRMPTRNELAELAVNCEMEMIVCGGHTGALLTSKTTGNRIFCPQPDGADNIFYDGDMIFRNSSSDGEPRVEGLYISALKMDRSMTLPWKALPIRPVYVKEPPLESIVLSTTEANVYVENTLKLIAAPQPVDAILEGLTWTSADDNIATVSDDGIVKGMAEGSVLITATCGEVSATASITVKAVNLTEGETIDMGTEVLWSPKELGATTPSDNGALYFWGNTTPRESSASNESEWTDPGVITIGGTEYDPAYVELGGRWHMPTLNDLAALADACDMEWIIYEGKRGALLTSTITGNRIFCPVPNGSPFIFYDCDTITYGTTPGEKPSVSGLYINPTTVALNSVRPWKPVPVRPVYTRIPALESIDLNISSATIYVENTVLLSARPNPTDADFSGMTWVSDNEAVATVNSDGVVTGMAEGTAIVSAVCGEISKSVTVTVKAVKLTGGETVDMGTEMLWAPTELGASSPADNGKLYVWGSTATQTSMVTDKDSWVYPGVNNIGGTQYDPARAELGDNWQMPSPADLEALANGCSMEWIVYCGKQGALLTSKTTGNTIFCPRPEGALLVFYFGDEISENNGNYNVKGLRITPPIMSMDTEEPWQPLPVRPAKPKKVGVSTPGYGSTPEVVAVYTIDGRKVSEGKLTAGIYIFCLSDGTCHKKAVK